MARGSVAAGPARQTARRQRQQVRKGQAQRVTASGGGWRGQNPWVGEPASHTVCRTVPPMAH